MSKTRKFFLALLIWLDARIQDRKSRRINAAIATESAELSEARKGWSREVIRADNAEAAVSENCKTIARLEKELAAERRRLRDEPIYVSTDARQ